jgi:hypothetical protein
VAEAVGTIGVIHRGMVHADFAQSLACLHTPGPVKIHAVEGSHIAWQRNQVCREMEGGWVFFLDTDQVCAPDTVTRLLAAQRPVISALIAERHSPFRPVAFRDATRLLWQEIPANGLIEVGTIGTGCVLIRRDVIQAVADPWFEVGQIHSERAGEDTWFSQKLREAGIPMAIDCGVRVGHLTTATIWPDPGSGITLTLPGEVPFSTPIEVLAEEEVHDGAT